MQLKYVFRAHLKSKFWRLHFKITQKSALKNFIDIKTFPTYFFTIFLQHHSNRPYPNVKMILTNFYIIKTIWSSLSLRVLDTLLTLLRVLLVINLFGCLDFFNKSPCLYVKLRIPFFHKGCFFTISYVIWT